ncbi:hypothetical protein L195_g043369 [Trifolium pratense]|uniref:Uncharacterized protein n=1 Tax=Trifolium pratense TaxID=57577 RepID=A0A2K3M913_TRIPR|nr:hypothetical protein L195_g043369 [Trifolium pratense]
MLAFALFCCVQKRKKKKTQETDIVHINEHKKVTETIVPGPFGKPPTVVITVEDDVHIDEVIKKNEEVDHGLHAEPSKVESNEDNISSSNEVATTSSPGREHHHENKS